MKSFRETHPDFGVASGPVDDQRYVDGKAQFWATTTAADVSSRMPADKEVKPLATLILKPCYRERGQTDNKSRRRRPRGSGDDAVKYVNSRAF